VRERPVIPCDAEQSAGDQRRPETIRGVVELDCSDNDDAIKVAERHADGMAMELWQRAGVVKRFDRAPPEPSPAPNVRRA
jgi:hypothetical protein